MGSPVKVCKEAFIAAHGIKKDKPASAWSKRTTAGTVIPDQRGLQPTPRKYNEEELYYVHQHIKSLPVRSSHYQRARNPNIQYLEHKQGRKSIKALWIDYDFEMEKKI